MLTRLLDSALDRAVPVLLLSATAVSVCVMLCTCAGCFALAWRVLRWAVGA